jgi:hypothetical protein
MSTRIRVGTVKRMESSPKAEPGWYPDVENAEYQRYWDGERWTQHIAPNGARPPTTAAAPPERDSRPCPYCTTAIPREAMRCTSCNGVIKYCPLCRQNVGVTTRQKFVGLPRGVSQTQYRCIRCGRVVDGPRF